MTFAPRIALMMVALFAMLLQPARAQEALSLEQEQAVQDIVREYLMKNPEIIVEAIREMQRRDAASKNQKTDEALTGMRETLENNPEDPVMGNPNGNITVVEFFDYRCGYCKKVFSDVQTLLKEDGNIRYVLKEWPILGDDSVYASRAAIAVWQGQQDKYAAFHAAMMTSRGSLSNDRVDELAGEIGVDVDKMKTDMKSDRIDALLMTNRILADGLNLTGTPAFIFGDAVVPGAIGLDDMRQLVKTQREQ